MSYERPKIQITERKGSAVFADAWSSIIAYNEVHHRLFQRSAKLYIVEDGIPVPCHKGHMRRLLMESADWMRQTRLSRPPRWLAEVMLAAPLPVGIPTLGDPVAAPAPLRQ